jgi:hypothetical protein
MPVKCLSVLFLLLMFSSATLGANSASSSFRQPVPGHRRLEDEVQSTDFREGSGSQLDTTGSVTTDTASSDAVADYHKHTSNESLKTSVTISLGAVGLTLLGVCAWAVNKYCCPKPVGSATTKRPSFRSTSRNHVCELDGSRGLEREPDRLDAFDGMEAPRTDSARVLNRILQLSRTPGASQYAGMYLNYWRGVV